MEPIVGVLFGGYGSEYYGWVGRGVE